MSAASPTTPEIPPPRVNYIDVYGTAFCPVRGPICQYIAELPLDEALHAARRLGMSFGSKVIKAAKEHERRFNP